MIHIKYVLFRFSRSILLTGILSFVGTACNFTQTQIGDNFYPTVQKSYLLSTVTTSSATVSSGSSVTLKLDLRDTNFNPFISTLPQVSFQAIGGNSTGVIGSVGNNRDGTYSASFTGVTAGTATTIHAMVDGSEIQSALPTVTVTGSAASQLVFKTQPGGAIAFSNLTPEPIVAIEDANGNILNLNSSVTISINSGSGALSGTTTIAAINGIATFTNLSIDTPGTKTFLATQGSITKISNSFNVGGNAPSVPGGLSATGGSSNIALAWTASSGSGSVTYNIFRSTSSGTGYSSLASGVSATSYSDLTALNGTTYYYVVQATSSGGTSTNSSEVFAQSISSFSISAVSITGASALQVSWGAATGAAAYTLKFGTATGVYGTTVSASATSPTTIPALTPGTTYYFMVFATNAVGGGTSVNASSESTGVPLAAFTMTAATRALTSSSVSWASSAGSTSYTLKYGTATGVYGTTVSTSATSPTPVSGLSTGTTYYYRVTAVNGSGSLTSTAEISQTTLASFTQQWATVSANASSYAISANIDFSGSTNSCELIPTSQTDSVTNSFTGGTFSGVALAMLSDGTSTGLKLASDGTCNGSITNCNELNSSWAPQWSSIVGLWHLNETSGSTSIIDSASTPHNGALVGGMTLGGSGKVYQAASFNGSNSYIQIGNIGSFPAQGTIAYWMMPASIANYKNPFSTGGLAGGHPGNQGIRFEEDSTGLFTASVSKDVSSSYADDTFIATPNALIAGNWYHVVLTWDKTQNKAWVYMNGVNVVNGVTVNTWPTTLPNVVIGTGFDTSGGRVWNGLIDEVAIWSTALSASEIATIYNRQSTSIQAPYGGTFTSRVLDAYQSGQSWTSLSWIPTLPFFKSLPDYSGGAIQNETSSNYSSLNTNTLMTGIVGLWHLDEAAGTTGAGTVIDRSGQGNNGTPTSVTFGSLGKFNRSASFSTSGNIDAGSGSSLNLTTNFTLSAWVNLADTTTTESIMTQRNSTSNWPYAFFSNYPSGGNIALFSNNGSQVFVATAATISKNSWNHVVVTRNGTTINFYINGVADASNPQTLAVGSASGSPDFVMGAQNVGGSMTSWFNGNLDEIAVWNRTLNSAEVTQLYQRGASRLKFQVRSCSDNTCTAGSPTWQGPDGTANTYFSELNNMSVQGATPSGTVNTALPSMTLQNYTSPIANNRYFQYRTVFESDSSTMSLMPELKSVTVGPNHYDTSAPTVISKTGVNYYSLSNAIQTLGSNGCASGVLYNLGVGAAYTSATWYWWNGSIWTPAGATTATANSATTIATNAGTFGTQVGTGTIYFKAFLQSSGSSACELKNLELDGLQ